MGIFIFWLLGCFVVALAASNRGRSGFGWFLLSVLISPLLGLLFVLVAKDLSEKEQKQTVIHIKDRPSTNSSASTDTSDGQLSRLERLARLHERGYLTREEYEEPKRKALRSQ